MYGSKATRGARRGGRSNNRGRDSGGSIDSLFSNEEFVRLLDQAEEGKVIVTLDDIDGRMDYVPKKYYTPDSHIGQRKLFMAAIQYLTYANDLDSNIFLYAGSAGNMYGPMLADLFPKYKYVYVDPNPHDLRYGKKSHLDVHGDVVHVAISDNLDRFEPTNYVNIMDLDTCEVQNILTTKDGLQKIKLISDHNKDIMLDSLDKLKTFIDNSSYKFYLIEDYFKTKMCEAFVGCVFMSDIRVNAGESPEPTDTDIAANLLQQWNWVDSLSPQAYSLKFRTPFNVVTDVRTGVLSSNLPLDVVNDVVEALDKGFDLRLSTGTMMYLGGTVYLQTWEGKSSTETRLVGRDKTSTNNYDLLEYESKLNYYNKVARFWVPRKNVLPDLTPWYDNSNDCALEAHILDEYNNRIAKINLKSFISNMNLALGTRVPTNGFGTITNRKITESEYDELYK